jgi:hypothetical protein
MPRGVPANSGTTWEGRLRYHGWTVLPNGCWEWNGTRHNKKGYGEVTLNSKTMLAHRVAYEVWVNPHLKQHVLHRCDYPPCINPDHLFEGSNADNVADKVSKGRAITARGSSHHAALLTEDQALEIFMAKGIRKGISVAEEYGISPATVSHIWHKRLWKHIHGEGGIS